MIEGSTNPNDSEQWPGSAKAGRHWLRANVGWFIAASIALTIGVAVLAVPPWPFSPFGSPSRENAAVWVGAFAASGTLMAVWAALRNADEAARSADVAMKSAAFAVKVSGESERREERIRHEAVRPVVSVREAVYSVWSEGDTDGTGGYFRIEIDHEAGQTGFDTAAKLETRDVGTQRHIVSLQPRRGTILRSRSEAKFHPDFRADNSDGDPLGLRFEAGDECLIGKWRWTLVCSFRDSLGWRWEQVSEPFELQNVRGDAPLRDVIVLRLPEWRPDPSP